MRKCHQNSSSSGSRNSGPPRTCHSTPGGKQMAHAQSYFKAPGGQLSPSTYPQMTKVDERASTDHSGHFDCDCFQWIIQVVSYEPFHLTKCGVSRSKVAQFAVEQSGIVSRGHFSLGRHLGLKPFNLVGRLTNRPPTCLPIQSVDLSLGSVELGGTPGGTRPVRRSSGRLENSLENFLENFLESCNSLSDGGYCRISLPFGFI